MQEELKKESSTSTTFQKAAEIGSNKDSSSKESSSTNCRCIEGLKEANACVNSSISHDRLTDSKTPDKLEVSTVENESVLEIDNIRSRSTSGSVTEVENVNDALDRLPQKMKENFAVSSRQTENFEI